MRNKQFHKGEETPQEGGITLRSCPQIGEILEGARPDDPGDVLDETVTGMRAGKPSPILVEVTGPAGSGKTSLTSSLVARGQWDRAPFISARDPAQMALFVSSLPRLAPTMALNLARPPRMTWADFKLMVYATTWMRWLGRRDPVPDRVLLLDQGPVYALVRLRAKGLGVTSERVFQEWWSKMLDQWLRDLSLIVLLDAPDDILLARIDQREQNHAIKGHSPDIGREFIRRYRELFDEVADRTRSAEVELLRFDTGTSSTGEIAASVADAIAALVEHGGRR